MQHTDFSTCGRSGICAKPASAPCRNPPRSIRTLHGSASASSVPVCLCGIATNPWRYARSNHQQRATGCQTRLRCLARVCLRQSSLSPIGSRRPFPLASSRRVRSLGCAPLGHKTRTQTTVQPACQTGERGRPRATACKFIGLAFGVSKRTHYVAGSPQEQTGKIVPEMCKRFPIGRVRPIQERCAPLALESPDPVPSQPLSVGIGQSRTVPVPVRVPLSVAELSVSGDAMAEACPHSYLTLNFNF